MKPEDVPQAWVQEAVDEADALVLAPRPIVLARQIIAAVAPLIAAAEREALWRDMPPQADEDNEDHAEWARGFNFCLDHLKAVIRAREEVK